MPHKVFGGKGNVPSYVNTFKINQQLMDIAKIDSNRVDTRQKIDKEHLNIIALEKFKSSGFAKENIKQAKNILPNQWVNNVREGGKWDYKSIDQMLEHVGNCNAGMTGAAMLDGMGLSRDVANDVMFIGTQGYTLYDTQSFDDRTDQYFVQQGFNYYANVKK